MITLVKSTCWNPADLIISPTYQEILIRCVTEKRNAAFASIPFGVKWNIISNGNNQSFQLSFELLFQLQIELEQNLQDQNLNELENELSRI